MEATRLPSTLAPAFRGRTTLGTDAEAGSREPPQCPASVDSTRSAHGEARPATPQIGDASHGVKGGRG